MNLEDSAPKKDLEVLQGTWRLISAMEDGKSLTEDKVKQTTIVIKDDATKKPKQMDTVSTEKEVMLGIYELEGDGYRVCFAPVGKPRPSEFTSKSGSGGILQVWEREKE